MVGGIVGGATRKIGEWAMKNSTTILKFTAITGVVGTAISTGKAVIEARDTIVAHDMDEELKVEKWTNSDSEDEYNVQVYYRERTTFEKAKLTWRIFLLPVFIGGTTISCIILADRIHTKNNLALAAAYTMSSEAAKEFRDKVVETIGEKKTNKIENEIAQDHINATPVPDDDYIIHTQYGEQLMYDEWSGRYFRGGQNEVEKKVTMLNKRMVSTKRKSCVNDLYELLGIPQIPIGEEFGWNYNMEYEGEDVTVRYFPSISSKGEPCIGVRINPELLHVRIG